MITLIAALSRNRVIGRDGDLPWRLPEDSRHFRRTTLGKAVIVGRGEYETRKTPLEGRLNIVMTRRRGYQAPGCTVVHDADVLTFVDVEVEGDTYFPEYDASEWREIESRELPADERHAYAFSIVTLERI